MTIVHPRIEGVGQWFSSQQILGWQTLLQLSSGSYGNTINFKFLKNILEHNISHAISTTYVFETVHSFTFPK